MTVEKWNNEWLFWKEKEAFALVWNVPEDAKDVTLPHDAMMEEPSCKDSINKGNTGYYNGGIYHYVKRLYAPKEYENQTVMLKFEGCHMNTFVYVNEQLAGKCLYGYSTFMVPLNDYLRYGEDNEIRVIVKNGAMTNSRWYSGGGIYRDVYLLVSGLIYIVPEGVVVTTQEIESEDEYAVLEVTTEVKNRDYAKREFQLKTNILNGERKTVSSDCIPVSLFGGEARTIRQRVTVECPKEWSEEQPYLYVCKSQISHEGKVHDENTDRFGIRKLSLDTRKGLRVNGKTVKLRGACIHHDSGLLGAATYEEVQYRQIKLLKDAGFNAVRMSHHPMAPAMLRACDELGMYVMDEAFDMWSRSKSDYDYGMNFEECWEKDIEAMVRKDQNHPSVILYSLGNEIPEIGTDYGAGLCQRMNEKIKKLDATRYTLASINGVFASGDVINKIMQDIVAQLNKEGIHTGNVNHFMSLMEEYMDKIVVHEEISKRLEKACVSTDIAGYNYMTARYEMDGATYPHRVIVGSETYPPDIARNWEIVERCSYIIGDFTWTGWDYIGEAGVGIPAYRFGEGGFGAQYPCQLAYCGDFDITGFRRPASYFREIVFGKREIPYIAVQDPNHYGEKLIKTPWVISDSISSWTWKGCEGKSVVVEVFAAGEEVELLLGDNSLGRKKAGKEAGYRTLFKTVYMPGRLTAVSYENGIEIGRVELLSAKEERRIILTKEYNGLDQFIYVSIDICDEEGTIATDEIVKLEVEVNGSAKIMGLGSGNPKSAYWYAGTVTETYNGHALAILKREAPGKIEIVVKGKGEIYQLEL